jgi:hypothetical protein
MQAKVALYNERWAEVITTVTELEGLGFYSLNSNYYDAFAVAKEYIENEDIFFYDHQPLQNPRKGNGICAPLDWGFIAPTASFLAEFEANDPRLLYTVNVTDKAVYKLLGSTTTQYRGNDDSPGNKIYIRMADVLLWKAEAYNETAGYVQAIAIINQVRARARTSVAADGTTPPAGTLLDRPASVDKATIKAWLIHERRVELGFESQRFNDLKRWKIAEQVLTTAIGKNFKAFNYVYPIPQSERDRSGGSISQNPGY